jgi:release factor glutamine methyltransferase
LAKAGEENPRLAAQWLLSAATGLERIELYTDYDRPLTSGERQSLREGIKRRVQGEPLQYIRGKAPFRRLELKVRPGVLIPRPETETLVDLVLDWLRAEGETPTPPVTLHEGACEASRGEPDGKRILDLGTGTGAIALSLLAECPGVFVLATDIDPAAVDLASDNAYELKLDGQGHLHILQDDLAASLIADPAAAGSFDVVVSNPPYIPTAELQKLSKEVAQYESTQALDGGADGLALFRRIVDEAGVLLKPGGLLACELYETTLERARAYCALQGFTNATIHEDLTGRPRFITAHLGDAD